MIDYQDPNGTFVRHGEVRHDVAHEDMTLSRNTGTEEVRYRDAMNLASRTGSIFPQADDLFYHDLSGLFLRDDQVLEQMAPTYEPSHDESRHPPRPGGPQRASRRSGLTASVDTQGIGADIISDREGGTGKAFAMARAMAMAATWWTQRRRGRGMPKPRLRSCMCRSWSCSALHVGRASDLADIFISSRSTGYMPLRWQCRAACMTRSRPRCSAMGRHHRP